MRSRSDARKVSRNVENPIDTLIYDISYETNKIFRILNFTPNVLTTISLGLTLYGIMKLYEQEYKMAAIFIFLGYFFDCADGNFARTYDMVTDFGDKYDHGSDTLKAVLLIIWFWNEKHINKEIKKKITVVVLILCFITSAQFGCEEKYKIELNKEDNSVLSIFEPLCKNKKTISYTRYFGSGTLLLVICIFIYRRAGRVDQPKF